MTERLTREEALLVGIFRRPARLGRESRSASGSGRAVAVVTMLCDTGERYLSVALS